MPHAQPVTSVLNKTKARGAWFLEDYTLNPFSGCSFNCLYCYIRGSKYGIHMDKTVSVKQNVVELLDKQLHSRAKKQQYGYIVFSSATDPYLHPEIENGISRNLLEIILKYRFPVHIITKSDGVLRDLDILHQIQSTAILPADLAAQQLPGALVTFSLNTTDENILRTFEPGAPSAASRLRALAAIRAEKLRAGISFMPQLPFITDTTEQLHQSFRTFQRIGIDYIFPASLTLFGNGISDSKTLVFKILQKSYPHLSEKYEAWFRNSNEMPSFYQLAFKQKMKELCEAYGLQPGILPM